LFRSNCNKKTFKISDETVESSLTVVQNNKDGKDSNKDNKDSTNNEANGRSAALERAYVHDVYENCEEPIGPIRPKVAQFLANLDPGSLVCDVGCGNGRYLTSACNPSIYSIGIDRCYRLSKVSRSKGGEVRNKIIIMILGPLVKILHLETEKP
jgi:SAM-dependent methyltransferase